MRMMARVMRSFGRDDVKSIGIYPFLRYSQHYNLAKEGLHSLHAIEVQYIKIRWRIHHWLLGEWTYMDF